MEVISFRCPECNQVLRAPPERAGRRARCSNCGSEVTVPSSQITSAAPKTPSPYGEEDDEEGGAYGFLEAPEKPNYDLGKPERKQKTPYDEPKTKPKRRKDRVRRRAPTFPEKWEKVRLGLLLIFFGAVGWGVVVLLQEIVLLVGLINGPEYAGAQQKVLGDIVRDQPVPGEAMPVPKAALLVGIISGAGSFEFAKAFYLIAQIMALLQAMLFLAGYGLLTAVPSRFGTRGQAIALLVVGSLNLIFTLVFKLLPMAGAMNYTLAPLFAPEVAMMDSNTDRLVPIHVFWSAAPYWEALLSVLIMLSYFAEPVLVLVFIRACGLSLRDEYMEPTALSLLRLAFGQAFIMMAYHLLSLCGTSDVLLWLLKTVYCIWLGFFIGFLIWYGVILMKSRALIEKHLQVE